MSDSVKKWHEMKEENNNAENSYLFVLDYLDGKAYRYDISSLGNKENNWIPNYETCEAFLIGSGHSISNIEWMVTNEEFIQRGN